METRTVPEPTATTTDEMPLLGIDHIELYVGNAAQAAYWFTHALGLRHTAYSGLETGVRDRSSYVVEGGRIRFVLTAGMHGGNELTRHIAEHGDGVKVVALAVPDAEQAYRAAVRRGAKGLREPHEVSDEGGMVRLATIGTYGETLHTFVERNGYRGAFMPGYEHVSGGATDAGLLSGVDHVVGNVELGRLDEWVSYYERVFGFTEMIHFSDRDIHTEYSALMSKVMADGKGRIKFPINEPAEGKRKSQIEEYLEFYGGAGVQHVALSTTDIVRAVRELRERGVRLPRHAGRAITRSSPSASGTSTRAKSATCASSGSSPTRTTRATCCRSSRSRSGEEPDDVPRGDRASRRAPGFGEGNFEASL